MVEIAYRRLRNIRPSVSFILLDWSARESFHSLDYLSRQTVERSAYEIIWIDYYQNFSPDLNKKICDYAARGLDVPLDIWTVLGMEKSLYYHKHLMYNVGIAQSTGDIIIICDSDAMFPPNFVETVIDEFNANPQRVIHFDEVRNARQDFYPFNYPSFEEVMGEGVINWRDGKTTGLWDTEDPLHTRNYGACFCARRSDLIAIGGADEHLDYLGHVCGPYELTFRLVNTGLQEYWHDQVYLYHTWHPGSDGEFNYIGPSDGKNMSTTALEARDSGRVMPLLENAAIRQLRQGETLDLNQLIDPSYKNAWTEEAMSQSPRFKLFERGRTASKLIESLGTYNIIEYDKNYYAVPQALGPVDLAKDDDRTHTDILAGASLDAVKELIGELASAIPPDPAAGGADAADEAPAHLPNGLATETHVIAVTAEKISEPAEIIATESRSLQVAPEETGPKVNGSQEIGPVASSGERSLGAVADDLLNIIARRQLATEAHYKQILQIEAQNKKMHQDIERMRTVVGSRDAVIRSLQDKASRDESRADTLRREAKHWQTVAMNAKIAIDLLPLLLRKDIVRDHGSSVSVAASSPSGHFLYGPYLPLPPGNYALEVGCKASALLYKDEPLLTVEIADGDQVLKTENIVENKTSGRTRVEFTVSSSASPQRSDGIEFRFSHHQNGDIEITKIELHPEQSRPAGQSNRKPMFALPRRWMRRLTQ